MTNKTLFFLGADHVGFALKQQLLEALTQDGYHVKDFSPSYKEGDDYPKSAKRVAKALQKDPQALGVLVCGTGHGMEMAANRFKHIRAFVARTEEDAKLAREHNHANVIVFGGWVTKSPAAKKILHTWIKAKPSSAARHKRRIHALDT
ncbi:hypothetical protein AUJ42_03305 [Candidatus Collierbacteria bacterium CG1_02_44_10]|uniref:Ribose-5-phosphate isomerase n=1 Tax=Candidatus Collierbacteria bacterium CG1_02_44_10 TaxID=1805087 RepID=A0A1J4RV42_9BACT|nr:MAG: hypothetical protein AUJ42_03305 [Candidatus Collierbacteria bacterium CG1_02_44_10]